MKLRIFFLIAFVCGICFTGAATTANKADDDEITGNSQTLTRECTGGTIRISGNVNKVTLTGICTQVDVTGTNNEVMIDTVGAIKVSGISNKVYWQKASKGKRPKISSSGINNVVAKAK